VALYIAGEVADRFRLPSALNVALMGVVLGIVVLHALRRTNFKSRAAVRAERLRVDRDKLARSDATIIIGSISDDTFTSQLIRDK